MKTNEVILQMQPLSCHLALLLRRAPPGSLGSVAGWGLWGERWLSWTFHQGHFLVWPRLEAWRFFLFPGIVGWFFLFSEFGFFTTGRLERRWLTSKFCWTCQLIESSTFAFYSSSFESALNYVCILHGTIVFDIFFINPNTKPLFIFLPFPHGHIVLTGGSRPGAPHHRRHHPKTPGGGPAPPSSCRARSAPRCESSAHAQLHVQPGCHPVEAGEARRGGAEGLWGERWPYRTFHQGHIFVWPRPEAWIFSCQFPNIAGLPFLGVIHRWDLHPHFIVVIGKMNTWQNCQIFPVNSCKWGL